MQSFQVNLSEEEMEIIQNALKVYMEYLVRLQEENKGRTISRADVLLAFGPDIVPSEHDHDIRESLDDMYPIESTKSLREFLVALSGYDMTEGS